MSVLNGPGEGTWSVFAEKVVAERDAAREEVARLRAEAKRADEEATALANSDLATTEQVIRALRTENERLRTEVAALREERDEALRLLATRVEAKRLDAAQEEIERLRAACTLAVCADLVEMNDAGVPCPPRLVVLARMAVAKARGEP